MYYVSFDCDFSSKINQQWHIITWEFVYLQVAVRQWEEDKKRKFRSCHWESWEIFYILSMHFNKSSLFVIVTMLAALGMSICRSVYRLVHHFDPDYWMVCHEKLYRHSWSPEDYLWWSPQWAQEGFRWGIERERDMTLDVLQEVIAFDLLTNTVSWSCKTGCDTKPMEAINRLKKAFFLYLP